MPPVERRLAGHRGSDLISKDQAFNLIANIVGPELLALVARLRRVEGALGLTEWDGQGLAPELTAAAKERIWATVSTTIWGKDTHLVVDESTGAKDRNHDDCG